jgi:KaiC/GvpD/RAD55 family RecA-like ATPase
VQHVAITEGEKDADNINALHRIVATTNAGGSNGWLDGYGDSLKGRDVVIFPDNDTAGYKRCEHIIRSIRDKANSVKVVKMPDGCKDISDWLESIPDEEKGNEFQKLIDNAPYAIEAAPIYSIIEQEDQYRDYIRNLPKRAFSLSKFAKGFDKIVGMLGPGEVVMIVGDTGAGKTAVMQEIARAAKPLPTLLFELELPLHKMFQRQMQMEGNCFREDVIKSYTDFDFSIRKRASYENLKHIMICPQSGIGMDTVERYIAKSELKFGEHPAVVMIDYMGLMGRDYSRVRYERIAYNAEQAKVVAKNTNTILFMGSQVARPPEKKGPVQEVELHMAKGAGELESSANLVLGLTRPSEDSLRLKVLKNNDGPLGGVIDFDFNGPTLRLREKTYQEEIV